MAPGVLISMRASRFPNMNFLVVDDNRLLNRFLTTYLRGKGHQAASLTDSEGHRRV